MTFTITYWERDKDNYDYIKAGTKYVIKINGKNAKECMRHYKSLVYTHDLFKYTGLEITNVED